MGRQIKMPINSEDAPVKVAESALWVIQSKWVREIIADTCKRLS